MKIYAMFLPFSFGRRLGRMFRDAGKHLIEFAPEIKSDIILANIDMEAEEYMVASVLSATFISALMFFFAFIPIYTLELFPGQEMLVAAIPTAVIGILDFFILIRYPRILANKRAEIIEQDLIYALKDLLLNISSGLNLYDALRRVSEGRYGLVSEHLREVVDKTAGGMPMDDALEELAIKTPSEYMRNAIWQTVNATKSGTSVKAALSSILETLIREHNRKIRNYIQELNVLTMLYMLFAIAVPTIITTVLVVLTSLMGTGVDDTVYVAVLFVCIMIQVILVGFIKSRRPLIYAV